MSTDSPLLWKHGANWLNGENLLPVTTRDAVKSWADGYRQAVYNINAIGKPHPNMELLPVQYNPEICLPGYAPRDEAQMAAIMLLTNWGRGALFAEMGAGKTFMGGYSAMHWRNSSPAYHTEEGMRKVTLVVVPKNVIGEWQRQPQEFFGSRATVFPDDVDWYRSDIVVTNYEQVGNLLRFAPLIGGIILDESHKIKNHKTLAFGAIAQLAVAGNIWHRMVLTGTPQKNKPDDLFSQLSFINPFAYNFSHTAMMRTYFTAIRMPGRFEPSYKFKNSWAFLFKEITNCNAVLMEAPAREAGSEHEIVSCGLTAEQQTHMEIVREGTLTVLSGGENLGGLRTSTKVEQIAIKNALMKGLQVSSGYLVAGNDTWRFTSEKLAKVYDKAVNEWADHQVIVWVYFRETADRLKAAFDAAGIRSIMVRGGMPNKAREQALEDFENNKARIAVLQLSSMNAGRNLQFCNHAIYAELDWAYTTIDQAVARIDRPGQTNRCFHCFYYTMGTTDELHVTAYKEKSKLSMATVKKFAQRSTLGAAKVSGLNPTKKRSNGNGPSASSLASVEKFFSKLN